MHYVRRPVAVIDIGSNAVRLVVFNDLSRAPVQLHTERTICGLGKTLGETGRLDPAGVKAALDSLARFSALINAMKIKTVQAVATAAVRDAADGPAFVAKVKKEFGLEIKVIDGEEEARLSALGVVANHGRINGLIGDFGGGSLELIGMKDGKIVSQTSKPLGALRIMALKTAAQKEAYIRDHLAGLDLSAYKGRDLYVLGGAWRTLARAHIFMEQYPIGILDNYRMERDAAYKFVQFIAGQNRQSLERMAGLTKRRVADMPAAALVLKHVLAYVKPARLIFSGTGLREGIIYDQLPVHMKKADPLLSGCREIGRETSRFATEKELLALSKWVLPLFPKEDASLRKSIEASCLLSDVGWFEHEDFRPRHAYQRVLNLPLYGLSHQRRAFLAIAAYVRHKGYLRRLGRDKYELTEAAQKVLTDESLEQAIVLGLAMRLAYVLTGGALSLLKHAELSVTPKTLTLTISGRHAGISGNIIHELLEDIAVKTGHKAKLKKYA